MQRRGIRREGTRVTDSGQGGDIGPEAVLLRVEARRRATDERPGDGCERRVGHVALRAPERPIRRDPHPLPSSRHHAPSPRKATFDDVQGIGLDTGRIGWTACAEAPWVMGTSSPMSAYDRVGPAALSYLAGLVPTMPGAFAVFEGGDGGSPTFGVVSW